MKPAVVGLLLASLAAAAAVPLTAAPPADAESPPIAQLASEDAALRFEAALALISSRDPGLPERLRQALRAEPFLSSAEGTAAADFVLAWRGGKRPDASGVAQAQPNILLVSIDTLRADHLGCYGYPHPTSPAIDALAARGAVWTNASSTSSWTLPAHMSMFTSLYPGFHKLERGGKLGTARLDEREPTLATVLRDHGYRTAGFVAHPFLSGQWGFDRGFDLYRRYQTRAGEQSERARLWLDWHAYHADRGMGPRPFFLFLHYLDPHETYDPPPAYRERFAAGYAGELVPSDHLVTLYRGQSFQSEDDFAYAVGLYDGEVRFVDDGLGRVLSRLGELGLEEDTIVAITSDHGEEFKDHGSMGHKHTLYEELVRVPLVISYPRRIAAGQRLETPVSLVDLPPTLLELAGAPSLAHAQGRSLVSGLAGAREKGARAARSRPVFSELGPLRHDWEGRGRLKTVRSGPYKLIQRYDAAGQVVGRELYRLSGDAGEHTNLYRTHHSQPQVQALREHLDAFAAAGSDYRPGAPDENAFEIDPETLERLRSLGYVD